MTIPSNRVHIDTVRLYANTLHRARTYISNYNVAHTFQSGMDVHKLAQYIRDDTHIRQSHDYTIYCRTLRSDISLCIRGRSIHPDMDHRKYHRSSHDCRYIYQFLDRTMNCSGIDILCRNFHRIDPADIEFHSLRLQIRNFFCIMDIRGEDIGFGYSYVQIL